MKLTLVTFELYLPGSGSLKDKRRVIRSLKERIRNRLNVSVAEVSRQEKWQRALLAVAWVLADGSGIDKTLNTLDRIIEMRGDLQVLRTERLDY